MVNHSNSRAASSEGSRYFVIREVLVNSNCLLLLLYLRSLVWVRVPPRHTRRPVPITAMRILFWGTGEKGNRLKGSANQSTFEGAVAEWAKTLRSPRTSAARQHTKNRDRRAHHHESSCRSTFFLGFCWGSTFLTTSVTGFCIVAVLYTLHGERPTAVLRNVVALCVLCQAVRETWWSSLITKCLAILGLIALFILHACGSSLLQYSRQQVCSCLVSTTTYRVFCTVKAALQSATNSCTGSQ